MTIEERIYYLEIMDEYREQKITGTPSSSNRIKMEYSGASVY